MPSFDYFLGIKPCVASFGGEQFKLPEQADQMGSFFSMFYASIVSQLLKHSFLLFYDIFNITEWWFTCEYSSNSNFEAKCGMFWARQLLPFGLWSTCSFDVHCHL